VRVYEDYDDNAQCGSNIDKCRHAEGVPTLRHPEQSQTINVKKNNTKTMSHL